MTPEEITAEVVNLAGLPFAAYALERMQAAKRLGMTREILDRAVKAERARRCAEGEAATRAAPRPQNGEVAWPAWVRSKADGLHVDLGEAAPPLWLCGCFDVLGEARAPDGTGWGLWLRWHDAEGRLQTILMPRRLLMVAPGELEAMLVDRGLSVNADPTARLHLRRALAEVKAGTLVTTVTRAGWHATPDAPHAYMLPSGATIGETGEPLVLENPGEEGTFRCATSGTLAGWQSEVAALAVGNPMAGFTVCCAFAGPLLLPAGVVSGGFHLAGGSKAGKTTACQMAATVWGPPGKGGPLRDWNSTANAFEAAAEEAGDGLLLLDEIHQTDARAVTRAIYELAGESGKSRLTRDATARKRRTWRTFILSNGEIDVATVAAKAGERLPAGAAVRLPSIPIEAAGGAWPNLHGAGDIPALMARLHASMRTHHGHATRAFLERLANEWVTDHAGLTAVLDERRERFVGLLGDGADPQSLDVARRFALVAAAGELATAWGVLPWPEGEASRAAEAMLRRWLASRGGVGAAEDTDALERVRAFLAAHGEARFRESMPDGGETPDAGRVPLVRAGFRKGVEGANCWLIFPTVWKTDIFIGADASAGAKALFRAGHLVPGEAGKLPRNERVPGFKGPVRFYVVRPSILEAEPEPKPVGSA